MTAATDPDRGAPATELHVRATRGLPGGRAVVGALLIVAAALGVFVAYLSASAEPTTRYLVAATTIEPGTTFGTVDEVLGALSADTLALSPTLTERAVPASDIEALVGQTVVAPMERGDLLTRTMLVDDGGVAPAQTMSFPISRIDAVAGSLRAGERIDVLATYGGGSEAYTSFIVRGVPLLRIAAPDGGQIGGSSDLILTVAVTDLQDVQALGHAVNTASVFVTRSTAVAGDTDAAPGAYRAVPNDRGPVPDAATGGVLQDGEDPGTVGPDAGSGEGDAGSGEGDAGSGG